MMKNAENPANEEPEFMQRLKMSFTNQRNKSSTSMVMVENSCAKKDITNLI